MTAHETFAWGYGGPLGTEGGQKLHLWATRSVSEEEWLSLCGFADATEDGVDYRAPAFSPDDFCKHCVKIERLAAVLVRSFTQEKYAPGAVTTDAGVSVKKESRLTLNRRGP